MRQLDKKPHISLIAAGVMALAMGACSSNRAPAKSGEASASASMNASASVSNERTVAPRDDRATTVALSSELRHECKMTAAADEAPQFDYDDAKLRPRGANILNDVASCLTDGDLKGRHITIVGHTDPRGTQEHNEDLGESRASAARAYLISRGVSGDRIEMVSRGEKDARGDDESTWALDRRVDIDIGSTASDRAAAADSAPAAGSGVLVQATAKTVRREPDPKRAKKGATYSDVMESGEGPPQSKAVPPPKP
jgi:peptidoglycan-associated lipoprotein